MEVFCEDTFFDELSRFEGGWFGKGKGELGNGAFQTAS